MKYTVKLIKILHKFDQKLTEIVINWLILHYFAHLLIVFYIPICHFSLNKWVRLHFYIFFVRGCLHRIEQMTMGVSV